MTFISKHIWIASDTIKLLLLSLLLLLLCGMCMLLWGKFYLISSALLQYIGNVCNVWLITLYMSMASTNFAASYFGKTTTVSPLTRQQCVKATQPYAWKKGSTAKYTSEAGERLMAMEGWLNRNRSTMTTWRIWQVISMWRLRRV